MCLVCTGLVMNIMGGVIYTYIKHWEGQHKARRKSLENGVSSEELLAKRNSRQQSLISFEEEDRNRTI